MSNRLRLVAESDRDVFEAAFSFLRGRLSERAAVEWALRLPSNDIAKRSAVLEALSHRKANELEEPWRTAWRIVEEGWSSESAEASRGAVDKLLVEERIRAGERTGALIAEVVSLVRPRVKVSALSKLDHHYRRPPRRPRNVEDLLSVTLDSGELLDPAEVGIPLIEDAGYLLELVNELDAALTKGVLIGRRLLAAGDDRPWRLGDLRRAYFVPKAERRAGEHEPDEFHTGIAPSTKLLYSALAQLRRADADAATDIVKRWKSMRDSVHVRLWAAAARDPVLVSSDELAEFIEGASDRLFWDLHQFPEITEVRANRFPSFAKPVQRSIVRRLRGGPPASNWPRTAGRMAVRDARLWWSVRELRRIEIAGGELEPNDRKWLEINLRERVDLSAMQRVDEGFLGTLKASWVPPEPNEQFDFLSGRSRLEALEAALQAKRSHWDADPARGAADWIGTPVNAAKVIGDLEAVDDVDFCPTVWDTLGWRHSPITSPESDASHASNDADADRVTKLLLAASGATLSQAIQGLTRWVDTWASRIRDRASLAEVWQRLWPIAVDLTTSEQSEGEDFLLSEVVKTPGSDEPQDLDTLNTPAGRLVGAFLAICPTLTDDIAKPFEDPNLRALRDATIAATGRAGLIARHRLIEQVGYFLRADPAWTTSQLLQPLLERDSRSIVLWRAVARATRFADVMRVIGEEMSRRASDLRLGRESRSSLAFSVVVEAMHAIREGRQPFVTVASTQQMIRSLDDEVRAHAANVVQRYVKDMAQVQAEEAHPLSPESLCTSTVLPFLKDVWPQERSLASPGVARAFADLPYTCRERFADAVTAIERFLVPFDAWSLAAYGLRGGSEAGDRLLLIDSMTKGEALLMLLDSTISKSDDAVVPIDLALALKQITDVAPALQERASYRRLAVLARR